MASLPEGGTVEVQGSGAKPYIIKHVGGVYSCSCPSWRNQSLPPDVRTCKHIKAKGFVSVTLAGAPQDTPLVLPAPTEVVAPPVLLAHSWDNAQDLTGWWISEKFDGVRCWWDGEKFISRLGNVYHAPTWFLRQLPRVHLDGELWMGRKLFQETVSAVRKAVPVDEEWNKVTYMVFDIPKRPEPFESRLGVLEEALGSWQPNVKAVTHVRCNGTTHLRDLLKTVEAKGGEGLMLREPGSLYVEGRSTTLLKVKTFHDAEAVVTGYEQGKGKHKGTVGALVLVTPTGVAFKAGTGLSDAERRNPPKVGSTVTYRYQELTKDGVPRFPSYVCCRDFE